MPHHSRLLFILRATNRPGMNVVIDNLESVGYFTRGAGGHHFRNGGLAQHSIEVYDFMKRWFGWGLPDDSIAVVALFHDLGKVNGRRDKHWIGRWRCWMSGVCPDRCGALRHRPPS